jgi:hypothetical protein
MAQFSKKSLGKDPNITHAEPPQLLGLWECVELANKWHVKHSKIRIHPHNPRARYSIRTGIKMFLVDRGLCRALPYEEVIEPPRLPGVKINWLPYGKNLVTRDKLAAHTATCVHSDMPTTEYGSLQHLRSSGNSASVQWVVHHMGVELKLWEEPIQSGIKGLLSRLKMMNAVLDEYDLKIQIKLE